MTEHDAFREMSEASARLYRLLVRSGMKSVDAAEVMMAVHDLARGVGLCAEAARQEEAKETWAAHEKRLMAEASD